MKFKKHDIGNWSLDLLMKFVTFLLPHQGFFNKTLILCLVSFEYQILIKMYILKIFWTLKVKLQYIISIIYKQAEKSIKTSINNK